MEATITGKTLLVRGMATVTTPDCESTAGFYEVALARVRRVASPGS